MCETRSSSTGSRPKKCSRTYAPSRDLNVWYSPSTHSSITLTRRPSVSSASNGSQRVPQTTLITFQPAPRKSASSSWMILPLPRTGPSRRCRLQFTTQIRLSRRSRPASAVAPIVSGSSISPSPRNAHTLRPSRVDDAARLEVLHEPGLVDRGDRADPERHRRELPELRHQPRVRIGRQAGAVDLLAEVVELLLGQAPLEVAPARSCPARSDPGSRRGRRRGHRKARARSGCSRPRTASPATGSSRCGRRAPTTACSRGRPSPSRSSGRSNAARRSSNGSPGSFASRSGGIVFTYGVVMLAIGPLPASCARWTARARIWRARSGPSCSTTASTASSHSVVSTASMSAPAPFELGVSTRSVMRNALACRD